MPSYYNDYANAAERIIQQVGNTVVIGVPLGLGKPIGILNALYRLAHDNPSIQLTIITGLTLARPTLHNELEKRFVTPILDRILKDYEDPLYEHARELQQLPKNIRVIEFFLSPGKYLHNSYVQQNYISSKYTSVVHDALHYSINVYAQQVAHSSSHADQYSLSCNTDLFHEIADYLRQFQRNGKNTCIVAEVNANLPYMYGDAVVNAAGFTDIVDTKHYRTLFAIPREEISPQDHLIGLYTSFLLKDNSCLEVGIGKLSNAVANALIMRQNHNTVYLEIFKNLAVLEKFGESIASIGAVDPFDKGIYASTEMLSDEYLQLYNANILKKQVYDHIGLQRLLNANAITEKITIEMVDVLVNHHIINAHITATDLQFLQQFGIFKPGIILEAGNFVLTSGESFSADLTLPSSRQQIVNQCLGDKLRTGKIIHAGFFLGTSDFYKELYEFPTEVAQKIDMTSITRTNALSWSPELLKLQRINARFINTALMITAGGGVVSDGLANLQELSGVGGQYDFVAMAQELEGARSIITCRSTRQTKNTVQSNIVWDYTNLTIPRYLRDIFVTEYGIADCRSKTDAEVIKSLINITDSRFQEIILSQAKKYGKVAQDYAIPLCFKNNTPERIRPLMRELQLKGYFRAYPFGSDLTDVEQKLATVLQYLKNSSNRQLAFLTLKAIFNFNADASFEKYFVRMQLVQPKTFKDFIYKKLLRYLLNKADNTTLDQD